MDYSEKLWSIQLYRLASKKVLLSFLHFETADLNKPY